MSLKTECMLVSVTVTGWSGQLLDRDATATLTAQAHADSDAARVNKHIVPKATLQPVTSASAQIRSYVAANTLPWSDTNNQRVLTRRKYAEFLTGYDAKVRAFDDAVETFIGQEYMPAVERARFRMGTLFDPNDYPQPSDLRRRFSVRLSIDPISDVEDFRVDLGDAEVARAQGLIRTDMELRLSRAMGDIWGRIADVVGSFEERMVSGGKFRKSTVEAIDEIVEELPKLLPIPSAEVEAIRQDIRKRLGGLEAEDLRKDDALRAEKAEAASDIMDRMRGFMSAMDAMKAA